MAEGLVAKPVQGVQQVWSGHVRTGILPWEEVELTDA